MCKGDQSRRGSENLIDDVCLYIIVTEQSKPLGGVFVQISLEEIIRKQQVDPFSTQIRARLNGGCQFPFEVNDQGYLVGLVEYRPQILVHHALQRRFFTFLVMLRLEPTMGEGHSISR